MKKIIFVLFFISAFFIAPFAFSQAPSIKIWDARFGGDTTEYLTCFIGTADSGFLLGGYSLSGASGNKLSNTRGGYDYWIVKTDSMGNKEWEQAFGGNDFDELRMVRQTSDGGYILGGFSASGISGDKSQPNLGVMDYWIIKTDTLGNKIWDKNFGGTNDDELNDVQQTSDGGYILAGHSNSGIGGDKSSDTKGLFDFWILKIDSNGNKLWDKDFGGTSVEVCNSIVECSDKGCLVAGYSDSNTGGDKSQNIYGVMDYWVVKLDSAGNKLWDRDFGGTGSDELHSLVYVQNEKYLLSGISVSGISGNKTTFTQGMNDYWIICIDSAGNKLWEKDFGGWGIEDEIGFPGLTHTGSILIPGSSYSNANGNKTENNLGTEQAWLINTDSSGNIKWDKTIFTTGHHESGYALEVSSGCYVIATMDNGIPGGYQSYASFGYYDFWMVKLCDSSYILPPVATVGLPQMICPGTCTNFVNLSSLAFNYQWSFPGAMPDTSTSENPANICYATPGSYSLTLIASNANGSDTLTLQNYITVFPQPPAQSITQNSDTLFAIAGSASYQWYFNGNSISGATDYFYVATASGDYNVVATDSNGCEVEAVINDVIASIQYTVHSRQVTAFPNPVTTTLEIRGLKNNSVEEVKIFNAYGEKVFSAVHWKLVTGNCELFPAGLYYIEITSDKKIYRTNFVKQ